MKRVLIIDMNDWAWAELTSELEFNGLMPALATPQEFMADPGRHLQGANLVILHGGLPNGGSIEPMLRERIEANGFKLPAGPVDTIVIENLNQDKESARRKWRSLSRVFNVVDVASITQVVSAAATWAFSPKESSSKVNVEAAKRQLDMIPVPARVVSADRATVIATNQLWTWTQHHPDPKEEGEFTFDVYAPGADLKSPTPAFYKLNQVETDIDVIVQTAQEYTEQTPSLDQRVEFVWRTLKGCGFSRMRFYRIHPAPGTHGVLSLSVAFGSQEPQVAGRQDRIDLHALIESEHFEEVSQRHKIYFWKDDLDGSFSTFVTNALQQRISSLLEQVHQSARSGQLVVSETQLGNHLRHGEGRAIMACLNELLQIDPDCGVRCIPVYAPSYKNAASHSRDQGEMVGLIFFDAQCPEIPESAMLRLGKLQERLLVAVKGIAKSIEDEQARNRASAREAAHQFVKTHYPHTHKERERETFISAFVAECMRLTGYDLGSMAWRTYPARHPDTGEVILPVVECIQLSGTVKKNDPRLANLILSQAGTLATPTTMVALYRCIDTRAPAFFQDGLEDNQRAEDLFLSRPRFALPLEVAGEVKGAIGFSVAQPRFRFLQRDIEKLEPLIELSAAVIYYLDAWKDFRDRANSFQHAIRSISTAARDELDSQLKELRPPQPQMRSAAARAKKVRNQISYLLQETHSFDVQRPMLETFCVLRIISQQQAILKTAETSSKWLIRNQFPKTETEIAGSSRQTVVPRLNIENSNRQAFQIAIRTIILNVDKHGGREDEAIRCTVLFRVRQLGDLVELLCSHPAHSLTNERLQEAFHSGKDMRRSQDALAREGATLELRRTVRKGVIHAETRLTWPIKGNQYAKANPS